MPLDKTARPKAINDLTPYAGFPSAVRDLYSREDVVRMSKRGSFPRHIRAGTRKAEPLYLKNEVLDWIEEFFGVIAPEMIVEAANELGITPAPKTRKVEL